MVSETIIPACKSQEKVIQILSCTKVGCSHLFNLLRGHAFIAEATWEICISASELKAKAT